MMKRIFILALLSASIGCASQPTVPKMPWFTTTEGKQHARECHAAYIACVSSITQTLSGLSAWEREGGLNNCRQLLKDCYETCE